MTDLDDQAAIGALLARFSGFFDAVLVEVHLSLTRAAADRRAMLRLLAEDTDGTWCYVTLTVARPREYLFAEGRSSNLVLSDGLAIHRLDDGVFVDLAPYTDQPVEPSQLRRSHQYVAGESCSVDVTEAVE